MLERGMAHKIALFNHKGGVSKTTTTFHLGWMLASKGKRVMLVDADPQCNLTGLVLGDDDDGYQQWYDSEQKRNIKDGLAPAFESLPERIKPVNCYSVPQREGLFLLPGHIRLSEYEVTLGIAQELSASIQTLQNLPGAPSYLLDCTAEELNADYVLIDLNPSLSSLNQNLLMTSQYFIVPTTPDYFSVMAIDSLANVLPRWLDWSHKASSLSILQNAVYPFLQNTPKFLGTIVQNYRPRGGVPARGFQIWIDKINEAVASKLVPQFSATQMMLPSELYIEQEIINHCLITIPDFNTLVAKSQSYQTPVFELNEEQIDLTGPVLAQTIESRDRFRNYFSGLADKVMALTAHANGD
jgi:cellulose biosynthesis protein BcsQ